ncbi:MAG: WxcM-like domain-containing protein [Fusobacteria bacterium]|nr:WxcM-like domain-containing protein [Fusobacteriota bacterium]
MDRGQIRIVYINQIEDRTANLCFMEYESMIPFLVKRVYYVHDIKTDAKRGFHAHKELHQFMFCPYGEIELELDTGHEKVIVNLDKPNKGLILKPGVWREFKSKKEGSVLCVLASEKYEIDDYVREYSEFKDMVKNGFWDNI